jgi:spermidine synthase
MKKLLFPLLLIGISSIIAQIVILRELLVFFSGNELSIGIILANWLFWTTIGSWLGGKLSSRIQQPINVLAFSEIFLSFFLLATIIALRSIKLFVPLTSGEILGIMPIWLYSFVLLAGICFVNGFLFVIGCRAVEGENKRSSEGIVGKVYILESLGSAFGGFVCSFLFLRYLNTLQIIFLLIIANLLSAGILCKRIRLLVYSCLVIILIFIFSGSLIILDQNSRQWQWKKTKILSSRDSIYGNITVTKQGSIYSFYENGLLAFNFPDELSNEESSHLTLLQHPEPKKILFIGGGAGGVINEALKYHSISSIDYIELDPLFIDLAKQFLNNPALDNPKVSIYNIDGRRFLDNTPTLYDVIIVNLPDPNTAQINRFYTKEFFKNVYDHLSDNGVFSIGVTSSENYISPELGDFLRCIHYTLKEIFPAIKVIPGDYCRFIASKNIGFITDDYKVLEKRLSVDTKYVRDYYLGDKLSAGRLQYLWNELLSKPAKFMNTDFHPVCYYYNITFWSTYFNDLFKNVFQLAGKLKLWHFSFLLICVLCVPKINRNKAVLLAIMTSGFSEISFQVVTLLAFQVVYGYVYYKLGIIFTSFMVGLALGSFYINRILHDLKNEYALFIKTQIAIVLYPLLLPLIFYFFARFEKLSYVGENIVFTYIPIIAGFIGGFQFPLGNKIYLNNRKDIGSTVGVTYGIDLFGSCIGVFLISAFILPILGIMNTCFVTVIVNLMSLIVLIKAKQ